MPYSTFIIPLILLIIVGGLVFLTQREPAPEPAEVPVIETSQPTPNQPAPKPATPQVETQPPPQTQPTPTPPGEPEPQPTVDQPQAGTPTTEEFTVEADDNGLYPSTIEITKENTIKLTFQVRSQGTYFGGLDFRSTVWGDTGRVAPGASKTVEFTASESFEYRSYWPSSGVLKAVGRVNVK